MGFPSRIMRDKGTCPIRAYGSRGDGSFGSGLCRNQCILAPASIEIFIRCAEHHAQDDNPPASLCSAPPFTQGGRGGVWKSGRFSGRGTRPLRANGRRDGEKMGEIPAIFPHRGGAFRAPPVADEARKSEWQRSADEEGAPSPTKMPGTATGQLFQVLEILEREKRPRFPRDSRIVGSGTQAGKDVVY